MTTRKSPLRRIAAAASALALVGASAVAFSAPASAAGFVPPGEGTGSLTLHKYEKDNMPGNPLEGVVFTRQSVGTMVGGVCTAPDLNTPAGWELANSIIDSFDEVTGAMGVGCLIGAPTEFPATLADGSTTASGLKGLYIIKETSPGPNLIVAPAVPFIVSVPMPVEEGSAWDFSVDAYPKNTLTTVTPTKTVGDTNVDGSVVPGALVPWTITVPVPVAAFPYTTIEVSDTPSAGHTFTAWTSVKLNGIDLDAADYDATGNPLKLTDSGLAKVNAIAAGATPEVANLTVGLTTTVNADVEPGTLTNEASVKLNGQTKPTGEPQSHWGKIIVTKHVKGNENAVLKDAAFNIYAKGAAATCEAAISGGAAVVASGTTDVNGEFSKILWIANAQAADTSVKTKAYCLVETAAPAGYILDSTPREFVLSTNNANHTTTVMFPNVKPSSAELPLTGAGGTLAMTVSGLVLVGAGAGAIAVSRRRSHKA